MKNIKNHYKKIVFICLIILIFTWVTTAFAIALDIDIKGLTQNYLNNLFNENSVQNQLESEKQRIKQETLDYVNQYKSDITNQLNEYQKQELELSKQELNKSYVDLKKQLDDSKQQILDEYKQTIKNNVDKEKIKKEKELKTELENEIINAFK